MLQATLAGRLLNDCLGRVELKVGGSVDGYPDDHLFGNAGKPWMGPATPRRSHRKAGCSAGSSDTAGGNSGVNVQSTPRGAASLQES